VSSTTAESQLSVPDAAAVARADYLTLAAFLATILLAGFNAIGVRYTVLELSPFWGATLRFGSAALLLSLIMLAMRAAVPRGRALVGVLLYGFLNFGASYAFLYWGLVYVPAGMTQVLLALVPLLTLFLAVLHRLEPFRWRGLLGASIAVTGVAIGFQVQVASNVPLPALLAVVAGGACMAEAGVIVKQFPRSHPITTNALGMLTGTVLLLALSFMFGEPQTLPMRTETLVAIAYLVLFGSIAVFMLFLYIVPRLPISTVSYQFVLFPFVTVIGAWAMLGEAITLPLVLGGALVLLGVWVGVVRRPAGRGTGA
jgi:drug/metabolite transporter (DMT)-like permease